MNMECRVFGMKRNGSVSFFLNLKFIVLVVFLFFGLSVSFAEEIPVKSQARLILKIITMDKNFDRFGDTIKIGVSSDEMLKAFKSIPATMKVKGKNFVVGKLNSLEDILKYSIIYIDSNWEKYYDESSEKAISNRVLTFCRDKKCAEQFGCAVTFKMIEHKPRILIKNSNARKQGTEFTKAFLEIAIAIDEN